VAHSSLQLPYRGTRIRTIQSPAGNTQNTPLQIMTPPPPETPRTALHRIFNAVRPGGISAQPPSANAIRSASILPSRVTMSSSGDLTKQSCTPCIHKSAPSLSAAVSTKRACTSSITTSTSSTAKALPPIQEIIYLPEDAVWALRKQDLRSYFLALQTWALNPQPLGPFTLQNKSPEPEPTIPADLPPLLQLPLEIRGLIYTQLLPPPCSAPIRGPHPRQLQNHVHLSQPIPSSLLRLNHQIRSEALPLLYGCPTQTVYIKIDYNVVRPPLHHIEQKSHRTTPKGSQVIVRQLICAVGA